MKVGHRQAPNRESPNLTIRAFLRLQESEKASNVQGGQCRSGVHLKAIHLHISVVAINHDLHRTELIPICIKIKSILSNLSFLTVPGTEMNPFHACDTCSTISSESLKTRSGR